MNPLDNCYSRVEHSRMPDRALLQNLWLKKKEKNQVERISQIELGKHMDTVFSIFCQIRYIILVP